MARPELERKRHTRLVKYCRLPQSGPRRGSCVVNTNAAPGYDDLGRLLNYNCGSFWTQTFTYDQYDNLTKSGSQTWNPTYSTTNNHATCTGCTYDSNGNMTNDGINPPANAYSYNEFGKMKSVNVSGTNCSSGGECIVYDAFGRAVEIDSGSTNTEIWYTQVGKTAYMHGATYSYAYWPAPGGGTALHANGNFYMHKDWLGSARIISTVPGTGNGVVSSDWAFAPYGEMYNPIGNQSANRVLFTGLSQDVSAGMYDTPNRELSSIQGRWLTPDPAHAGWNQYAYVDNMPLNSVDPLGLYCDLQQAAEGCGQGGMFNDGPADYPTISCMGSCGSDPMDWGIFGPNAFVFYFGVGQFGGVFDPSMPGYNLSPFMQEAMQDSGISFDPIMSFTTANGPNVPQQLSLIHI